MGALNLTTLEDTRLAVPAPGLLAAAFDADGDPLSVVSFTQPAHDFNGDDSFTISISDGDAPPVVGTVRTTVGERVAAGLGRWWARQGLPQF